MRTLYTIFHLLILPLLFLRLAWRGTRNPGYWYRWPERLGFVDAIPGEREVVWIHAVSVGEVQASLPIVNAIRERLPESTLLVTTTTPTGSSRVAQALGEHVVHCYMPYDLPGAVRRFLDRTHPSLAIIMETELWPNVFHACRRRGIAVILANVRLSQRSAAGYRRFASLTREMLTGVDHIAAQGKSDADRLIELGADPTRLSVTGSVKFDLHIAPSLREQAAALRRRFGAGRSVWIAASTHDGEERMVMDAFADVREQLPGAVLIVVPRHPERFSIAEAVVKRAGWRYALRSRTPTSLEQVDVLVGDTMGELPMLYAASDLAFVGGSLVTVGGHNVLEPAALGIPVIFGPHVFNFQEISQRLLDLGIARQVADSPGLAAAVTELLQDANQRHNVGQAAKRFVEENRGARDKVMAVIEPLLGR